MFMLTGRDYTKPYPRWILKCLNYNTAYWQGWFHFWCAGCWTLKHVKMRIQDYDPDYPPQTEEDLKKLPPLIIMNH